MNVLERSVELLYAIEECGLEVVDDNFNDEDLLTDLNIMWFKIKDCLICNVVLGETETSLAFLNDQGYEIYLFWPIEVKESFSNEYPCWRSTVNTKLNFKNQEELVKMIKKMHA